VESLKILRYLQSGKAQTKEQKLSTMMVFYLWNPMASALLITIKLFAVGHGIPKTKPFG